MTRSLMAVLLLGVAMAAVEDSQRDAAVALAKKTLSRALSMSGDAIRVEKAEAVDWPDASLGCPEKGMIYAQMITPGHKVELKAGGKTYLVHVGDGRAVVCGGVSAPPARRSPRR